MHLDATVIYPAPFELMAGLSVVRKPPQSHVHMRRLLILLLT